MWCIMPIVTVLIVCCYRHTISIGHWGFGGDLDCYLIIYALWAAVSLAGMSFWAVPALCHKWFGLSGKFHLLTLHNTECIFRSLDAAGSWAIR